MNITKDGAKSILLLLEAYMVKGVNSLHSSWTAVVVYI